MPYSDKLQVETWAQLDESLLGAKGYDYVSTVEYLINQADRAIDNYLMQPEGFFNGGGVQIQKELHDGTEFGYVGYTVFLSASDYRPFLRLKYTPVLSVTKFEEETTAGTWTTRTEGRSSDYMVDENGVYIISNLPEYDYRNIRVTYKAGYTVTPSPISECSARLAGNMAHRIIDSAIRINAPSGSVALNTASEFVGIAKSVFTDDLKALVREYMRKVPVRLV